MPGNERLRRHRIERNWRQQKVADELGTALITYQRWEQGKQQPSAYYRVKLCNLFGKSAVELGLLEEPSSSHESQTPAVQSEGEVGDVAQADVTLPDDQALQRSGGSQQESLWNVPFVRNPFFTGRSKLLERLHEQLSSNRRAAPIQSAALSGLGGIGKTQTAIEYAYRYREEYRSVFWVRAESRETLTTDYIAIAQLLDLPGHDTQEQMQVVATVKRWWQEHEGWLLILDNADDLSLLADFLPRQGYLLLTTRAQATGKLARSIPVEKMEVSEGIRLLLRRATLLSEDEPLETLSAATRSAAQQLAEELDGLPLALDQAGAYIEETGCSLADYLALYADHRLALLSRLSSMVTDYPHTVDSTWMLSFEKVEQANPAAADLLRLCAFLHPDAIPEEIMIEGATVLGPQLQQVVGERLLFNEAIQLLRRYSLVKRDAEAKLLNLHRLVQVVLQDRLSEAERHTWAERAILAVNAAFPSVEHNAWPQCERLLSQALTAAQLIKQYQIVSAEAGRLLQELASYLTDRARYAEAEPLYQQALHIREEQLGPEHPDVASSLNALGILYNNQGKFAEAEPLYQQALHIWEQLEPALPDMAYPLANLAELYRVQGKFAEAEPLYQRALRIVEQLGPVHPSLARVLVNFANLYLDQGKPVEAEPLYQQALRIWEQLGPEHSSLATVLVNLATLYYGQGKYAEAEPLYLRALHIWEHSLGSEHPAVAHPLTGLALLYSAQGKYDDAEVFFLRALRILDQQLGPKHPETAELLDDFAAFDEIRGNQQAALSFYQRALTIREQALGSHHRKTTETRNRLINLLRALGQHEEAAQLEVVQGEQKTPEEERKAHPVE